MQNTRADKEMAICDLVLNMDRPFKASQLLREAEKCGIANKDLVLGVIDQLSESGAIKYSEIKDGEWAYQLSNR